VVSLEVLVPNLLISVISVTGRTLPEAGVEGGWMRDGGGGGEENEDGGGGD
jgi:hypothetical protein